MLVTPIMWVVWGLAVLGIAAFLVLVRDRVERYPDGRPVDPTEQYREGYACIVMPHAVKPKIRPHGDLPQPPKR